MIRSICGGLLLAVCSFTALSGAPRPPEDLSAQPMTFALHRNGPAEVCGGPCRVFVTASGMIMADTPKAFDAFAKGRDLRGATVVFDSKGGSVLGAIALGRSLRKLALNTTVGRLREAHGGDPRTVTPRGECQSMCPFVLLGGVKRFVPPEAQVLVHQIWLGDRRDDAVAANYSAEDLMLVQRDIGRLVLYTNDMGGGAELLEVALRIPPWEPMRALSRDELRRTRLDTSATERAASSPAASSGTAVEAAASGETPPAEVSDHGWVIANRDGHAVLSRRHPLTVEGDRIGSFELTVRCGANPDSYAIGYSEDRQDNGESALKQVDLWIEGETKLLDLRSSDRSVTRHELDTQAAGAVASALLKSFAETPADTLTVRTTATRMGTMIRVGNSGFGSAFPRLAASCKAGPVTAAAQPR